MTLASGNLSFVNLAPHAPGVYLMKDSTATVIYVGKAKDLKNRIRSYFANKNLDDKTLALVENVADVEFILTSNETEALVLESNLIKKFKGKYNVELKESYRYPFVRITNEEFPRIVVTREPKKNIARDSRVFGPFVDGSARHRIIGMVEKTFKIRTCQTMPKKACLKFFIGQCTGPCIKNVSKEAYNAQVQHAVDFFSGRREELVQALETEMRDFSKKQMFEQALERKKALEFLAGRAEPQVVDVFRQKDQDFIAVHQASDGIRLLVLPFRRGTLLGKKTFFFASRLVGADLLEDFLLEYYRSTIPPHEIFLSDTIENAAEIESILSVSANRRVQILTNPKGDSRRMLKLAEKNLAYSENPLSDPLLELQNRLLLPKKPVRIEAVDISHQSGNQTVGSIVVFENAKPNKAGYRHFIVSTVKSGDDYAAMHEVLDRRFSGSLSKELPMPDLLVVDGGKGQLSTALSVLSKLRLVFPAIGLAKRNEEVFVPSRRTPIELESGNPGLGVLIQIRDEAHRFANRLRKIRSKKDISLR